jgi:hypothetical protein
MAGQVFPGRYTAELGEEGAVVFLIGMRFNAWWRVDKWWAVFTAMPRMLADLARRDAGLLGYHLWPGRTFLVLQYWRSVDELYAFAVDPQAPHAQAWRDFNRRVGAGGSVGVWHETYPVGPGRAEAIYANMPAFGLAAATTHVPVGRGRGTAKQRLAAEPTAP